MTLARFGQRVLLITGNVDRIGHLSCNPAIGGLAKGHMVREIDALGGMMGLWADRAGIQFRTLNASKGPAVRATRAQIDRDSYMEAGEGRPVRRAGHHHLAGYRGRGAGAGRTRHEVRAPSWGRPLRPRTSS